MLTSEGILREIDERIRDANLRYLNGEHEDCLSAVPVLENLKEAILGKGNDKETEDQLSGGFVCLYCGEAVPNGESYCCEEHKEGRSTHWAAN